jgi:predicted membrane channel-forming protein YqfA (hemolysin III family)
LLPWSANSFECHNAIWHVFVLAASACFFAVAYVEVAGGNWQS